MVGKVPLCWSYILVKGITHSEEHKFHEIEAAKETGLWNYFCAHIFPIDFYVLPHYLTAPFKKVTAQIAEEFSHLDLCPINNAQAIIVEGSSKKVIGN